MINEVLYMEMRLLQQFCKEQHCSSKKANHLFNQYGIWDYIENCYDTLHMNGDAYVLNDLREILVVQGAAI